MNSWVLHHGSSRAGRTYTRPLGTTELGFYWDSLFNGTADTVRHAVIEVVPQSTGELTVFEKAWIGLKRQYPLLGANLEEQGNDRRQVNFVVNNLDLGRLSPGEVELQHVSSDKKVQDFIDQLVNGKRRLSNQLLARLFVLVQDISGCRYHILIHAAHCITDGMSNLNIIRTLLEDLSSPKCRKTFNLEERLALAMASEDLSPIIKRSRPVQRWHRAMGHVILSLRMKNLIGGHTLPRTYSTVTRATPATSGVIKHSFTEAESSVIMKNCKKLGLTLNSVLPVLGQVALTRLLCRRYVRGDIDAEEWEFRKKEPMMTAGPLNLRPFLDRQWRDGGGASNVCLSISFFVYRLPFMPLGAAHRIAPGDKLPTYAALLSAGRFLLRSQSLKKQAVQSIKHPLFHEIAWARMPTKARSGRETALTWINAQPQHRDATLIPVSAQSDGGCLVSHTASGIGNIDNIVPRTYNGYQAKIKLCKLESVLHCRPAELYLGSSTSGKKLTVAVFWDKNVYDGPTVIEWLSDVVEAAKHYLGQDAAKL